ncbi:23S rRNA (cytosine1962-C5)-methyltransferase [Neorhodopirellula lusitana]|uniref:23S rRNA (Cytosine1962-C5)-methyltransferase n=1 Tax=Neorhodopirellula lusitana TaxID=445327 RepID=A0ABY1QAL1_9BACT|nr:class I SAM-dependent rRNA methyltransferase [Neorhodopirellula lusitana]SMP65713.1 23S rRNA (cytosine1962-C5)-methyltransferase [Neorhodopirellula lusitana]
MILRTKPNRHFPFLSRHPWVLATALADGKRADGKGADGKRGGKKRADDKRSGKHSKSAKHLTSHQNADSSGPNDSAELTPVPETAATVDTEPASADPAATEAATPTQFGQIAELLDHDGNWIGRGLYNPASRLRLRLYSFEADQAIDDALFARRVDESVARRRQSTLRPNLAGGGERLVFSESDLLSGLIVDRYADCLSIQFTSAALLSRGEFLIDQVLAACEKHGTPCGRVVCRMDPATAKHEGVSDEWIAKIESWSRGLDSEESGRVWYQHHDLKMAINLCEGQKTGGYLDQQDNHAIAASYMKGRRVLDVCTYTGGFALSAALAGAAEVIGIDSSEKALELARQNAAANSLDHVKFEKADCFDDLKERGQVGEKFDAVILDPPRFAGSRRQVDAALRAYARLNMSAVDLLNPSGILVTCSCSGHVSRADFLNMLVDVGRKRRRDLVMTRVLGPSADHPCAVSCPESDYLKCVIAEVQ